MEKYDFEIETDSNPSIIEAEKIRMLCAIANELAERNNFIRMEMEWKYTFSKEKAEHQKILSENYEGINI